MDSSRAVEDGSKSPNVQSLVFCDPIRADTMELRADGTWRHPRLPMYDRLRPSKEHSEMLPPASVVTDDLGVVCRLHQTCYDLHTGEIREWCPKLNEDGSPPGFEFVGDVSKNQTPLDVFPCRVSDGYVWISFE